MPELIFVVGCNAAGKSTFIRTRLSDLEGFEVLMTDVYKGRTKALAQQAIANSKNVVIETVFNDASFKDIVDLARNSGYKTALIVLFLDEIQHSLSRAAFRGIEQNGIIISGSNIKINFNESFKNVANYFFYFDRSDFIFTGKTAVNQLIMTFHKSELVAYHTNNLQYPQKFARYSFHSQRLSQTSCRIITLNENFVGRPPFNSGPTSFH